jgi:hypothetical protein
MKRHFAVGLAVGLLLACAFDAAWGAQQRHAPGVVVLCEKGGVGRTEGEGNIGSGFSCIGHDSKGGFFSAAAISIYDDEGSP